ncbi:uncharacterized protein LOC133795936 [Humulus lupulus]|uniref:uncharacterized protein LOC133795936 n=1 Tax=Humulus lupulus TaxID=3486 RepID=UPI002B408DD1|nr:uncharacterized protein LOC133795936 [Humulus lupulus]
MKGCKISRFMESQFLNWDYHTSSVIEGRLLIVWRRLSVRVIILEESTQAVHCLVKMTGMQQDFGVTFVYGLNSIEGKDRTGGKPISDLELSDSIKWLAGAHVEPLKNIGSYFTWTNNQDGAARIYSKIDHALINEKCYDLFSQSSAVFSWEVISDHCSCLVRVQNLEKLGSKIFRFYNYWVEHHEFLGQVLKSWRTPIKATGCSAIYLKLLRLKHCLKAFNMDRIGDIKSNYHKAKDSYQDAQMLAQAHPHDFCYQEAERKAAADFSVQKHKAENGIVSYITAEGQLVENYSEVVSHFLGPDGYGSGFFKAVWSDIGDEVCDAISQCFEYGRFPFELHETTLSLIPKTNQGAFVKGRTVDCPFSQRRWVMSCVRSTSYFLVINGRIQGKFKGEKGLRQGDPMSPLLFVLIMEYLTRSLQHVPLNSPFRFHPMCKSLKLINLCFADDLLIFCKGTLPAVRSVKVVLDEFATASGLFINSGKSQFFLVDFQARIEPRLLLRLIFQKRSKLHIPSWQKVRLPKAYGGLGFRDGAIWNRAVLAKYVWALSSKTDLLWVKWINSIYLKGGNIWNYEMKGDCSWYWRKLCRLKDYFRPAAILSAVYGETETDAFMMVIPHL